MRLFLSSEETRKFCSKTKNPSLWIDRKTNLIGFLWQVIITNIRRIPHPPNSPTIHHWLGSFSSPGLNSNSRWFRINKHPIYLCAGGLFRVFRCQSICVVFISCFCIEMEPNCCPFCSLNIGLEMKNCVSTLSTCALDGLFTSVNYRVFIKGLRVDHHESFNINQNSRASLWWHVNYRM